MLLPAIKERLEALAAMREASQSGYSEALLGKAHAALQERPRDKITRRLLGERYLDDAPLPALPAEEVARIQDTLK